MRNKNLVFLISLIVVAYIIRIIYSDIHMVLGDTSSHVLASLRLHLTTPLATNPLHNSFGQMLQYEHGYTTMLLPFLVYEFFFNLLPEFARPILNESNLVIINSLFGLMNILSIYYFLRVYFGDKSKYSVALLAVIPIQIALSRVFVGWQLFQSTFLFLSLAFLHQALATDKKIIKLLYFISTFLYIGSDNTFFIGLFFHILYIYMMSNERSESYRKIYYNRYTILFIILPVFLYIIVSLLLLYNGIEIGYLFRVFMKSSEAISFNPLIILGHCFKLIGPPMLLFLIGLMNFKKLKDKKVQYLLYLFIIYFLLLSLKADVMEKNYVFFLIVPIISIPIITLSHTKMFKYLYGIIFILTIIYSASVVYGLDIGFETPLNYGSLNREVNFHNYDYGVKTLGYLIRSEEFAYSKEIEIKYGNNFERIAVFIDYESAPYYLGSEIQREYSNITRFENFVVAYLLNDKYMWTGLNTGVPEFAATNNLSLIGVIERENNPLIKVYSNLAINSTKLYDAELYNKKFDEEYGNIDDLSDIGLGFY